MTGNLKDDILNAISYKAKEKQADEFPFRHHLGASILGHSCERYLFFTFRWVQAPNFSSRTLRIFERGHQEEDRLIDMLRSIGMVIQTVDPDTNEQIRATGLPAHIGGSMDGVLYTPATYVGTYGAYMPVECKTHNKNSFSKTFSKELHISYAQHYTQGNIYATAMGATHFMYVGLNKDNDSIDFHFPAVDTIAANIYINRGRNVIHTSSLSQLNRTDEKWRCKMCDFKDLCYSSRPAPSRNCRSCKFYAPIEDGTWLCQKKYITVAKYAEIDVAEFCDYWTSII